jgi:imidazolonepropionase-like amidohydrolase
MRVNVVAFAATLALAAYGSTALPVSARPRVTCVRRRIRDRGMMGGTPRSTTTLVVEAARIAQVGKSADVRVPAGATRVNLAGKTVMPDLIDTHTHLSQTREELILDLRRRAYYGVSAALSMGTDETMAELDMRGQDEPGLARAFTAWHGITRPEPGRTMAPFWINTEEQGRKAVQELTGRKVDIVKIWVDDRDGKYQKLTPALYGGIIDEAHKNGLRVTAHIFTLEDAKGLLRAGVDAFAHSVRDRDVDDEIMTLVKQHPNLVVNPNLPDRGVRTDVSWLRASLPAAEMQKVEESNTDRPRVQQFHQIQARNLAKLNAAGTRIILRTDSNTRSRPHVQIGDMVFAGLAPRQRHRGLDQECAEFLRMSDAGTIAPGKSADCAVLDADPLDNITNTRRIAAVYLRGVAVDRTRAP